MALVLGVWAVSLGRAAGYAFVWDDVHELQANAALDEPLLDGMRLTQTERTDPSLTQLHGASLAYDSYRPLLFASYWAEARVWGRDPMAMHVDNLVLGALAIVLAYLLCCELLSPVAAAIATALFALHPVQIEAVAYVSGRGDLLAGLLALAAVLAALRAARAATTRGVIAWTAAALLAFAGSLACKEADLGVPIAVFALLWATSRGRRWIAAAMLAIIPIDLAVRAAMVTPTGGSVVASALRHLPGVWLDYARIVILPFDLSIERAYPASFTWLGLAAVGIAGLVLAWRRGRPREVTAGIAWFAALLGPAAVPIAAGSEVADRYTYLAVLGAAIALVAVAEAAIRWRPRLRWPVRGVAIAWAALLLVVGWRQVPVWRDNLHLYAHAVELAPESSEAHYRLAYLAAVENRWDAAIPELQRAIALDPTNVRALDDLGVGLLRLQRPSEAVSVLLRATAVSPAWFRAWSNLGLARLELGDHDGGCADLRRALSINPAYERARDSYARRCSSAPKTPTPRKLRGVGIPQVRGESLSPSSAAGR